MDKDATVKSEKPRTPGRRWPSLRFSLRWLLGFTALIAIGFAALAAASPVWLAVIASISALAYLTAALIALVTTGPQRATAIGFTLWGVCYLGLVSWLLIYENIGPGKFPTTWALKALYSQVAKPSPQVGPSYGGGPGFAPTPAEIYYAPPYAYTGPTASGPVMLSQSGPVLMTPDYGVFMQTGQLLCSWLIALAGSILGRQLFARFHTA